MNTQGNTSGKDAQQGIVLVMALLVLLVMSVVIMGFSTDVEMDILISRNLQLKHQAFNWAETGMDIAEGLVGYSVDTRGGDKDLTPFTVAGLYRVEISNPPLFNMMQDMDNPNESPNVRIFDVNNDGSPIAGVKVRFQGSRALQGGSIVIAAGYEGVGKGAAGAGGFSSAYQLLGLGYESHNSRQAVGTMYRHVYR